MNAELLTLYGEDEDIAELGFVSDLVKGGTWLVKKGVDEIKYQQKKRQKKAAPKPPAPPAASGFKAPAPGFLSSPYFPLVVGAGVVGLIMLTRKKGR